MPGCILICKYFKGRRNREERRLWEYFERKPKAVSIKTWSGWLFYLPEWQWSEAYITSELSPEGQRGCYWLTFTKPLDPTENLWDKLKNKVAARRHSNLEKHVRFIKEKWAEISQETCLKFTENYTKSFSKKYTQMSISIW